MKSPSSARVLVAADEATEARQLVEHLKKHFDHVASSIETNAETAAADFEKHAPEVIVLAFKGLEHAERYYLGLHRFGQSIYQRPHRTVLLCRREDTEGAFELCKKGYFDDYNLYWPNPQDGLRVVMSVWLACRELLGRKSEDLTSRDLRTHVSHLEGLDRKLAHEFEEGERQAAAAHDSLLDLEHDLSRANDELSSHLVRGGANGAIEVKDSEALARDLAQFKQRQIERTRMAGDRGIKPISAWARDLKAKVEPSLTGARALSSQVERIKPKVLVVDDDGAMRDILEPVLISLGYEVTLAVGGNHALRELAHSLPDAILMDIRLTDSDGVTLTRQLKASPHIAHIPIILMTGDSRREQLISSIEAGAADFIAKPFTIGVLRAKLEKVLRPAGVPATGRPAASSVPHPEASKV
ncbi:MAG TPA: response regulator [Steroidobacteraceae bacterium]|jgi:CheY-like chemotaxis protein